MSTMAEDSINNNDTSPLFGNTYQDADTSIQEVQEDLPDLKIRKPTRRIIVEPVMMLLALSISPMMTLNNIYIVDKISNFTHFGNQSDNQCFGNSSDPEYISYQEVQAKASQFSIYTSVAYNLPALVTTVFLGAYSDKVGRKIALLVPMIGALIGNIIFLIVYLLQIDLLYLLISMVIQGATGGMLTVLLGCFSYIADITTPDQRQFRIAVLDILFLLTAIFGPMGVGYWLQVAGYLYPLLFVLAAFAVNILYVIFLVPETIIRDPEARFFDAGHILATIKIYRVDNETKRRWKLCMIIACFFLVSVVNIGNSGVDALFVLNHPLCWQPVDVGNFSAAYIAVAGVGGLIAAKLLKLCLTEEAMAFMISGIGIGQYVYKSLVKDTVMMYIGVVFAPMSVLLIPTIRAMMSKLVDETEQGKLFGSIAFAEVACSLIGSVLFTAIYKATLHIETGFVYFTMAIVLVMGTSALGIYMCLVKREERQRNRLQHDETENCED